MGTFVPHWTLCVCVRERRDRVRERERGGSSDTCSLSLRVWPWTEGCFWRRDGGTLLAAFWPEGCKEREEKRDTVGFSVPLCKVWSMWRYVRLRCRLFSSIPILSFSQVRVHRIRVPAAALTGVRLSAPNWRERRSWGQWGWEGVAGGVVCFCEDVFWEDLQPEFSQLPIRPVKSSFLKCWASALSEDQTSKQRKDNSSFLFF